MAGGPRALLPTPPREPSGRRCRWRAGVGSRTGLRAAPRYRRHVSGGGAGFERGGGWVPGGGASHLRGRAAVSCGEIGVVHGKNAAARPVGRQTAGCLLKESRKRGKLACTSRFSPQMARLPPRRLTVGRPSGVWAPPKAKVPRGNPSWLPMSEPTAESPPSLPIREPIVPLRDDTRPSSGVASRARPRPRSRGGSATARGDTRWAEGPSRGGTAPRNGLRRCSPPRVR